MWWAECVLCVCVWRGCICVCEEGGVCVLCLCVATTFVGIDDLGWEGYNNIIHSHQCPHPVRAPVSRVHCFHMMHP